MREALPPSLSDIAAGAFINQLGIDGAFYREASRALADTDEFKRILGPAAEARRLLADAGFPYSTNFRSVAAPLLSPPILAQQGAPGQGQDASWAIAEARTAFARLNEAALHQAEAARRLKELHPKADPLELYRRTFPQDPLLTTLRQIRYLDDVERALGFLRSEVHRSAGFARSRAFVGELRKLGLDPSLDVDAGSILQRLLDSQSPFDRGVRQALATQAYDPMFTAEVLVGLEVIGRSPRPADSLRENLFFGVLGKLNELRDSGAGVEAVEDRTDDALHWIQVRLAEAYDKAKAAVATRVTWENAKRLSTVVSLGGFAVTVATVAWALLTPAKPDQAAVGMGRVEHRLEQMEATNRTLERRLDEALEILERSRKGQAPSDFDADDASILPRPLGRSAEVVKATAVYLYPSTHATSVDNLASGEVVVIVSRIRLWVKVQYLDPATGSLFEGWVRPSKIRTNASADRGRRYR